MCKGLSESLIPLILARTDFFFPVLEEEIEVHRVFMQIQLNKSEDSELGSFVLIISFAPPQTHPGAEV